MEDSNREHEPNASGTASLSYDDDIVRKFATATLVWGLVATVVGLAVGTVLLVPKVFGGDPMWSFGRMRPIHTNIGVLAFAGNAVFAAIYYSTQRLCKTRMWSSGLSRLHFWSWQLIILVGAAMLPYGYTQGKEYAEFEWPVDIAIAVAWILFFGVNFFVTIARRRERHLYVSLWFYMATIISVGLLHVLNNIVLPLEWTKSYSVFAGAGDAMVQWFYGHNGIMFLLIMPFLGLMYYFVPKATNRPIYSYRMAIVHFWAMFLIYVWAGPHHLHYTAAPQWASSLGMLFSVMLWMPSWLGAINGLKTISAAKKENRTISPVTGFFTIGLLFFGLVSFGGPLMGVKSFNSLTHYSDWTIAHVHSGTLGWNGMLTFGMIYWLTPRLFQTKMWSDKAVTAHLWIATAGILLFVLPLYIVGFLQARDWSALDGDGQLVNPEFAELLPAYKAMWGMRLLGGVVFIAGMLVMFVNYVMTWVRRPSHYVLNLVPALQHVDEPVVESPAPGKLSEVPMLDFAKKLETASRLDWHRCWERMPGRFVFWVTAGLLIAGVFELVPTFLVRGEAATVEKIRPYTPLELAGRDLYIAEGCFNCHSQNVRPLVAETKRFGDYSRPEEFAYDHPFQWGSRRIGPDLARVGGRKLSVWHWKHFENPREENEHSVMPSFSHLLRRRIDFDKITQRVEVAAALGAEYDFDIEDSPEMARLQAEKIAAEIVSMGGPVMQGDLMTFDTQAVALIAYLQRLGTDLLAAPPKAEPSVNEPSVNDASLAEEAES